MDILKTLAEEFKIKEEQVKETVALIDEGNTIPFISRYRKEVTGGLDDATLRDLNDRLNYLRKMDERREEISNLIDAQGKLTPEITFALNNAKTLVELEDIYLPYRPKRKTRASVARDKGLELIINKISELDMPVVLTGDFNISKGSELYNKHIANSTVIRDSAVLAEEADQGGTAHGYGGGIGGNPIDFVCINNQVKEVKKYKIIRDKYNDRYVSDHYPIYSEIVF